MSEIAAELPSAHPAVERLDTQRLTNLMGKALSITRGEGLLLASIVNYTGCAYGSQITKKMISDAQPEVFKTAYRRYMSPWHPRPEDETPEQSEKVVRKLIDASFYNLNIVAHSDNKWIFLDPEAVALSLIKSDIEWLPSRRSRRRIGQTGPQKPFRSNFMHYGIVGHETGFAEIDDVMRIGTDKVLSWLSPESDDEVPFRIESNIDEIVIEHLAAHPNDQRSYWDRVLQAA